MKRTKNYNYLIPLTLFAILGRLPIGYGVVSDFVPETREKPFENRKKLELGKNVRVINLQG